MPQFRKRPIVVEAEQFHAARTSQPDRIHRPEGDDPRPYVVTIHDQRAYLDDKDWVIVEPDGEHAYPCKPDIFEATYELVEDAERPQHPVLLDPDKEITV